MKKGGCGASPREAPVTNDILLVSCPECLAKAASEEVELRRRARLAARAVDWFGERG